MHHHGYLWVGPKSRFDDEALRRPPHPDPPPAPGGPQDVAAERLLHRYREVAAGFPTSDLPPLETAYWLLKPRALVRGTWAEPGGAITWLGSQLRAHAPRFTTPCASDDLTARLACAAARLSWGGDVSLGLYLERPAFLSLALVTCSPHRGRPELPCPSG
ncbi:hypothetical protein ACIPPJ_28840 [Streptomyces sp. NPDC086091]|uniref:hypothetical protein n=1 Tax=Streptomyces sp. NPDC086091 TaxID=3365751 RepID=UPI00380112F9